MMFWMGRNSATTENYDRALLPSADGERRLNNYHILIIKYFSCAIYMIQYFLPLFVVVCWNNEVCSYAGPCSPTPVSILLPVLISVAHLETINNSFNASTWLMLELTTRCGRDHLPLASSPMIFTASSHIYHYKLFPDWKWSNVFTFVCGNEWAWFWSFKITLTTSVVVEKNVVHFMMIYRAIHLSIIFCKVLDISFHVNHYKFFLDWKCSNVFIFVCYNEWAWFWSFRVTLTSSR